MKILVVTKNWLGDVLFQIPAIEQIKARYPGAEIVCLSPSRCREILLAHPAVSRVIVFDEKNEHRSVLRRFGLIFELRRERWDRAYLFHPSRTRAFILAMAGVKERIGAGLDRKRFLTRCVEEPPHRLHHVDYFLGILRGDGFEVPDNACYRFYFSEDDRGRAAKLLGEFRELGGPGNGDGKGYVCFHLGANWEHKRWPAAHFARLADLIHAKWKLPVILTGSEGDRPLADEAVAHIREARVFSIAGRTSLGQLGAVFEQAAFVVSGDSGPMHIASGVGAPVAALFGPTDPNLTGPRGIGKKIVLSYVPPGYSVPWKGDEFPAGGWLSHIRPEEVAEAVEKAGWAAPAAAASRKDFRPAVPKAGISRGSESFKVREILVVTLTNIGDAILNTPVIMSLASRFPDARMTVVTSPRCLELFAASRFIHRRVVYDKRDGLLHKWRFLRELWKTEYDIVVDLKNTAIPFLVKARKRSPLLRKYRSMSARSRHLELLSAMGLGTDPIPPFDFFGPREEASLAAKLCEIGVRCEKDWIAAAPCAASDLKAWRAEGFAEVLARLADSYGVPVLLVGSAGEKEKIDSIARVRPGRIFNAAGMTTLAELAALVSRSSLVLCNDSSVMQLGFEMGRRVVAIFGPTDPERYGRKAPGVRIVREIVSCSPCGKAACAAERQWCLEDLKTEKVFEACRELLDEAHALSRDPS